MSSFKAGNSTFKAPGHKSTRIRGSYMDKVSVGVQDGLSAQSDFDGESHGPGKDNDKDSLTGNATERPQVDSKTSVSSKGNTFEIC